MERLDDDPLMALMREKACIENHLADAAVPLFIEAVAIHPDYYKEIMTSQTFKEMFSTPATTVMGVKILLTTETNKYSWLVRYGEKA